VSVRSQRGILFEEVGLQMFLEDGEGLCCPSFRGDVSLARMLSPVRLMSLTVGARLGQNYEYIQRRPIRSQNFLGEANQISGEAVATLGRHCDIYPSFLYKLLKLSTFG
jgi:hypothetical protein